MAQYPTPEKAANAPPQHAGDRPAGDPVSNLLRGQSERPRGIGYAALAMLALLVGNFLRDLLELHRAMSAAPEASPGATRFGLLWTGLSLGIGVFCAWQLWRGRSWARLLVLLWSFASVARALSFLSEHNLDPAALMGRPLSFFQAVLGAVLLYWLNTPKVRAWYRKSSAGAGELMADRLRGRLCTEVDFHFDSGVWRLQFEHDAELTLRCPWRIVLDDNLAFATAHEGDAPPLNQAARSAFARAAEQQPPETVPAPGHSLQEARRLIENLRVRSVKFAPRSSDLFVSFEMGIELQTWSAKAGTPAPLWEYSDPALMVTASGSGVAAQLAAPPPEAED